VSIQDIITDDEIISDSYDLKEVDGVVYEVDCQMITLGAVSIGEYPRTRRTAGASLNAICRHRCQCIC
jgi:hypothetical protein